MKATFCAYDKPNYVGGPNSWLRRLLPELRSQGIQIRVLFMTQGNPDECPTVHALYSQGFDCPAILAPVYTEDRVRWILKQLAQDPPDVFVPNLVVPAYYAGRWVRRAGIPTIGVLHSDDSFYQGLLTQFVLGDVNYRLSALVCVSEFLERQVLTHNPNGILIRRIPCGVPIPKRMARPPAGTMRLVYTGRLVEEQKRVSDLTRAFCRVVCEVPHTEAVIYGGGPAEAAVKQIISVEGKGLPVYFAGRIDSDQVQEHLLAAHVLVLLSDYEGLPISLMEAMACGVVPVCLRVRSGIPELVEDGITGLLVDDRGDAFISAVRRLREDPYLWERLSRAARAKVEASYSNEVCAMHWGELLRDLWKRAKPRPLSVPKRFSLPPVHAGLAREDQRQLPTISLAIQKARRLAGRIKRACFAVFHAKNHERVYPY